MSEALARFSDLETGRVYGIFRKMPTEDERWVHDDRMARFLGLASDNTDGTMYAVFQSHQGVDDAPGGVFLISEDEFHNFASQAKFMHIVPDED